MTMAATEILLSCFLVPTMILLPLFLLYVIMRILLMPFRGD